jgi:hypothetical protein
MVGNTQPLEVFTGNRRPIDSLACHFIYAHTGILPRSIITEDWVMVEVGWFAPMRIGYKKVNHPENTESELLYSAWVHIMSIFVDRWLPSPKALQQFIRDEKEYYNQLQSENS